MCSLCYSITFLVCSVDLKDFSVSFFTSLMCIIFPQFRHWLLLTANIKATSHLFVKPLKRD